MAEPSSPERTEREDLIQGYLDGTLDPASCDRLLALMKDDPSLGHEVVADLRVDEMLRKTFRDQHAAAPGALPAAAAGEAASSKQRPSSKRIRRASAPRLRVRRATFNPWPMALLAASLMLAAGAYLYFSSVKAPAPVAHVAQQQTVKTNGHEQPVPESPTKEPGGQTPRAIARIVSLPQGAPETAALIRTEDERTVRLALKDDLAIRSGDRLETGTVEQINVRYENEATALEVGSRTIAVFGEEDGAKRIALERGSVQADVAPQPQGKPLVFTTPQASAEVLGTRLVLSSRDDASCLAVTHGKVMLSGKQERKRVLVSTGEYAVAGTYEPLEARMLAPAPGCCRLIEDNERGLTWSGVPWSDPVSVLASNAHAASGTSAVRLEYRHRPQDMGGRGYGMISHPLALTPDDRFICTRVYVERTETPAILNALFMLKDGGGWFMRDVRLTRRPAGTWFTFVVPVQTPKKKNNEVGGDRYDPAQVVSVQFSIFGGSATVYLDDLGLSAVDPLTVHGEKP